MAWICVKRNWTPSTGLRRGKSRNKHDAFHPCTRQTTRQEKNLPQHCGKRSHTRSQRPRADPNLEIYPISQGRSIRSNIYNTTQIPTPKFQRHLGDLHTNSIREPQGNKCLAQIFRKRRFRPWPSLPQANATALTSCVLLRKLCNV